MKKLLLITLLLISNLSFCQLKSVVINSETKEEIPFVNIWVENENLGTTSNKKGSFELEFKGSKVILFSAIGFETIKISSDSINDILELKPQITALKEVTVSAKKEANMLIIEKLKKSETNQYFGCGAKPWITAKYFEYQENYHQTPFLNKIRLITSSYIDNAKFNIRLYSVGKNGAPEDYLYDQNIIGRAEKGKKITEIDISDLNINFPENGFFIAMEWLIIESNKYEYRYTMENSKKKMTDFSYEPAIGVVPAETGENSWFFSKGKWTKIFKNIEGSKKYKNKYNVLALELKLSN